MKYPTLMKAQMGEWPDSLVLTPMQMYEAMKVGIPDWLQGHKFEDWAQYEARHEMGWFAETHYREWRTAQIEQVRAQWARSAFMYIAQDPEGFFYACGKRPDGTYRHVGFRYGTKDSEYASGFVGMTYTPVQEEKAND